MKENLKYLIERVYPYFIATLVSYVMYINKMNYINDGSMDSALDGVNTTAALIIGFLGAMLPVILGMKNESKIVKYVFEKDSKKLFLKYIKSTIMSGLILVATTVIMYFRNSFLTKCGGNIFYVWIFLLVCFLFCTYRSLSNMLNLVFAKDSELNNNLRKGNNKNKTAHELELEDKYNI